MTAASLFRIDIFVLIANPNLHCAYLSIQHIYLLPKTNPILSRFIKLFPVLMLCIRPTDSEPRLDSDLERIELFAEDDSLRVL